MMRSAQLIVFSLSMVALSHVGGAVDPPHLIPFQGHLTQPSSGDPSSYEPVADGQYDILFTLYTAPVGGEGRVWGPERHEDIVVVNGLVNAMLGSVIGFEDEVNADPNFFARTLYVGITIDADGNPNTTDLELVPRQVFLSSPFAINASRLDGSDWRDFFVGTDDQGSFSEGTTKARDAETVDGADWRRFFVGTNANAAFVAGQTKAKDSDLFDGIDSAAVFVNPDNTASPKVKRAQLADGISGDLAIDGALLVGAAVVSSTFANSALHVEGEVSSASGNQAYYMVPRGSIVMWAGLVSNIPSGWALCNGENGTPDLTYRFIYGASDDADVGLTGGSSTHRHSYSGTTSSRAATNGVLAAYNSYNWFTTGHSHTYSGNTGYTSTLPPYYQLAYIMRL